MTKEDLKNILENHKKWLNGDKGGERANLYQANLCEANLCGANLCEANLCRADLREANLYQANLCEANLSQANLYQANLYQANLCEANLCGANLYRAGLYQANLCEANLYQANLYQANLCEANLCGANLIGTKNIPFIPYACPDFGSFIGYKKAGRYIVELEILSDAKRLSATGRKCRCDRAKVLSIQNIDGTKADINEIASDRDVNFIYKIGEIVSVLDFDINRWHECSTGIYFFINRQEAVKYN